MNQSDAIFHQQLGQYAHRAAGVKLDGFQILMARNFSLNGDVRQLANLMGVDPREVYMAKYGIGPYEQFVSSSPITPASDRGCIIHGPKKGKIR